MNMYINMSLHARYCTTTEVLYLSKYDKHSTCLADSNNSIVILHPALFQKSRLYKIVLMHNPET